MSMVTIAKLHCVSCGNDFPISATRKPQHIECPFCQSRMADDMIENLYGAILSVADINHHFRKYNIERDESAFVLSVTDQEVHLAIDDIE
ncbi:hypothetical protein [Lacticaseibacillus saniviri]|nr:hypothetical protein [Lacticaseibacillus saniviri]